jgi:hypothetical protein
MVRIGSKLIETVSIIIIRILFFQKGELGAALRSFGKLIEYGPRVIYPR